MMISYTRLKSKVLGAGTGWCPMYLACVIFRAFIEGVLSGTAVVSPHPLSFTQIILSLYFYAPLGLLITSW